MPTPDHDDLDARFTALMRQIDAEQAARMRRAGRRLDRRRRRHDRSHGARRRVTLAAWLAVAAVAAAGAAVTLRPDLLPAPSSSGPVPEETRPVATRAPRVVAAPDPFAGSPAAGFADGEGGLVLPPARAMAGLSAKEVGAALRHARALLAASHLDRPTLAGERPRPFIALLSSEQRRGFLERLDRKKGWNSRWWVTGFAPGTAELASDVIKVDGDMTVSAGRRDGRPELRVHVYYLFVYAIRRPGNRGPRCG